MEKNDVKMHCNTGGKPCPLKDSDGMCTLLDEWCKKDEEEQKVIAVLYKLSDKLEKGSITLKEDEEWAIRKAITILQGNDEDEDEYMNELEYAAWEANQNWLPFTYDRDDTIVIKRSDE